MLSKYLYISQPVVSLIWIKCSGLAPADTLLMRHLIQIKNNSGHSYIGKIMSGRDLVRKCNEAMRRGVDFPTL
jgi:hypothetical protein